MPKPTGVASKGKQREKPLASLLAGATAGAIEGFVTYPTEYAKTQLQFGAKNAAGADGVIVKVGPQISLKRFQADIFGLNTQPTGPIGIVRDTIANKGIRGLYAGCTALVVGNAVKAGVRFLSYDQYKSMLTDADVSSYTRN